MHPAELIQATAILSLLLWTKVVATNLGLGGAKAKAGTRAPEDTYQHQRTSNDDNDNDNDNDDGGVSAAVAAANDRAQRIVNNDLENIPYTMVMAWGALVSIIMVGAGGDTVTLGRLCLAHTVLYSTFVAMRIMHSIAYIYALAYVRTFVWAIGLLCSFGLAILGVFAASFS